MSSLEEIPGRSGAGGEALPHFDEAESALLASREELEARLGEKHDGTRYALAKLVLLHEKSGGRRMRKMRTLVSIVAASRRCVDPRGPAHAQTPGTPRKWAHESSDLPVDPRIHFGALTSGMRYAWVHQPLAEDKTVHLRLHVDVGSLVESETELGMAHFVEHMAFNGTKNFKAGTLIDDVPEAGRSSSATT